MFLFRSTKTYFDKHIIVTIVKVNIHIYFCETFDKKILFIFISGNIFLDFTAVRVRQPMSNMSSVTG